MQRLHRDETPVTAPQAGGRGGELYVRMSRNVRVEISLSATQDEAGSPGVAFGRPMRTWHGTYIAKI